MNLITPQFIVSYYNNLFSTKAPDNEFDINQLIEVVKYGYLKDIIENLINNNHKNQIEIIDLSIILEKYKFKYLKKNYGYYLLPSDILNNDLFYITLIKTN